MLIDNNYKSSVADRETVGKQVYDMLSMHACKKSEISAGDLGREMGKKYLKELDQQIEANSWYDHPYYVLMIRKKAKWAPNVVTLVTCARKTKPVPEPDCDLWYIQNQIPYLEWSLPGDAEMDMILKMGEDFDPQLIDWITSYKLGTLS